MEKLAVKCVKVRMSGNQAMLLHHPDCKSDFDRETVLNFLRELGFSTESVFDVTVGKEQWLFAVQRDSNEFYNKTGTDLFEILLSCGALPRIT